MTLEDWQKVAESLGLKCQVQTANIRMQTKLSSRSISIYRNLLQYRNCFMKTPRTVFLMLIPEKYLMGGWLNRLALSLASQLPNEVDWAFNKLISLSYMNNFYIGYIPQLPQILLDILNSFFANLTLNTSPIAFETTAGNDVPPMESITMFNSEKTSLQIERVLQCLHIIRNLTFMHENAVAFSKDSQLLHVLAKSMALPSVSIYIEIKHHALDIFENCSRIMPLRGPTDFYLACLKKIVFQNDKALIVSSLKCLNKLATNEQNEPIIHRIETPFLQRLLQLLLVPDDDIANQALEFLYLFSNVPDSCQRLSPF